MIAAQEPSTSPGYDGIEVDLMRLVAKVLGSTDQAGGSVDEHVSAEEARVRAICGRIRQARVGPPKKGTVAWAAKKVGVGHRAYTNYERNRLPDGPTLTKIARALGVSTEWLLRGDPDSTPASDAEVDRLRESVAEVQRQVSEILQILRGRAGNGSKQE